MRSPKVFSVFVAALAFTCVGSLAPLNAGQADLLERLRAGGLVIYFRHGDTRSGQGSVARLAGCEGERNLSDVGRKELREVRAAFEIIDADIAEVLSSPYCRARETGLIAFGEATVTDTLRPLLGYSASDPRSRETLRLLSSPNEGALRIMIARQSNLRVPTGIALEEGEAAVLEPPASAGDDPVVLARIMPDEWEDLVDNADLQPPSQ